MTSVREIINAASKLSGYSAADFKGRSRKLPLAHVRQCVAVAIYGATNASMITVGRALGGRDHTTILHAIRAVKDRESPDEAAFIRDIIAEARENFEPASKIFIDAYALRDSVGIATEDQTND